MSFKDTLILFFDSGQQTITSNSKNVALPDDTIPETIDLSDKLTTDTFFTVIENKSTNLNETYSVGNLVTVHKNGKEWKGKLIEISWKKGVWLNVHQSMEKIWIYEPDYVITEKNPDKLMISFSNEKKMGKRKIIFLRSNIKWEIVYHIYIKNDSIFTIDQIIIIQSNFDKTYLFREIKFIPKSMLIERQSRKSSEIHYEMLEGFSSIESSSKTSKNIQEDEIDFKLENITITPEINKMNFQVNIANIYLGSELLKKQKFFFFCEIPSNDYSKDYTVSSFYGFRIKNDDKQTLNPGEIFFYNDNKKEMEISGSGFMNKVRPREQFDLLVNEFPKVYCKIQKQITEIKKEEKGEQYIMKTIDLKMNVINTTNEPHNVMLKYFIGNKKYNTIPYKKLMNGFIEWGIDNLKKEIEIEIKIIFQEPYY